jgi:aerobic carbon-monoxide dehydrogenase medium subunit
MRSTTLKIEQDRSSQRSGGQRRKGSVALKAPRFSYARPSTIAEAIELLSRSPEDARVLAGGQSLVPMLNLRVLSPSILIDINRISGLGDITVEAEKVRVGALTRHAQLEASTEISRHLPLLAQALPYIAHPAIRNRGTLGGSCAFADPAAEIPACSLALNATFILAGPKGKRRVAAQDFFLGLLSTALRADEILIEAEFPKPKPGYVSSFGELTRRKGDYALVGVAAYGSTSQKRFSDLRIALCGVSDRTIRATHLERELDGKVASPENVRRAVTALEADIDPRDDVQASSETKRHLAKVLAARVLSDLVIVHNGVEVSRECVQHD